MESPRRRPPGVDPWVVKVLTATLVVIALALVALVVLTILGLMYLVDLIRLLEPATATIRLIAVYPP